MFEPVAETAALLAKAARAVGVTVVADSTLDDLSGLFHGADVVTVVAHWRGAAVGPADILLEPVQIAARMQQEDSPFCALLQAGMPDGWHDMIASSPAGRIRVSRFAELIDARLSSEPILVASPEGID